MNNKEKGDLLETVIEQLCSGIEGAGVKRNARVAGKKTDTEREIDVLIQGKCGAFNVTIAIESKNYAAPVGVERVESFKAKLEDIGADLGVMVCPTGFTDPAKNRAAFDGIQLFKVYDPQLGNTDLFIPFRYVEPNIHAYSFTIEHRAIGRFEIPSDVSRWRFHLGDRILTAQDLVYHAWNNEMIPQRPGRHVANFNAVTLSDVNDPKLVQYCELAINILVIEKYYLKLFPASFLKNLHTGEQKFHLRLDLYSKEEDMTKNGWKTFPSLEELNKAADIENQPEGIRNLLIRPHYSLETDQQPSQ